MTTQEYTILLRGSRLYGTNTEKSDIDIFMILDTNDVNELSKYGTTEVDGYIHKTICDTIDVTIMTMSQFTDLLNAHDISALESYWYQETQNTPHIENMKFGSYFTPITERVDFVLDKWKLRESIMARINNSWAKCHKKLIVEKDYDLYIAQKSLFHVIRILAYGIQIAKHGKIINYECVDQIDGYNTLRELYDEIVNSKTVTWNYYNEKYRPLRNKLQTELKKLCPK